MNRRTFSAVIWALAAYAFLYGLLFLFKATDVALSARLSPVPQALPAIVAALAFQLLVLLPVWLLLQHTFLGNRGAFALLGILLWFAFSAILFHLQGVAAGVTSAAFAFLWPGVALVLCFTLLVPRGHRA